ncbi:MAG: alpha/beta hydrolase [Alphaproteobacteria bacterium]
MALLSGPRLAPARGPATHLVVLCHGFGADGNDLIELAPHWQRVLPGAAFVSPHAPERCPISNGYQWFPLNRIDPHEIARGVVSAAPLLAHFIESELKRLDLGGGKLILAGFSQGAMMALHVGLGRTPSPVAIVGYSGLLVPPEKISQPGPPVFLAHGDADATIPATAMFQSAAALGAMGLAVRWHLAPGMGHSIDAEGLGLGGRFLAGAVSGAWSAIGHPLSCATGARRR